MEKISTPREALLPRATNLLTLTVVVMATWWSGAQRPAAEPALATAPGATVGAAQPQAKALSATSSRIGSSATVTTSNPGNATAAWPVDISILPRDGLQIVGYRASIQR